MNEIVVGATGGEKWRENEEDLKMEGEFGILGVFPV